MNSRVIVVAILAIAGVVDVYVIQARGLTEPFHQTHGTGCILGIRFSITYTAIRYTLDK